MNAAPCFPRPNRFGLAVAATSLLLTLATVAVVVRGDQVDLAPLDVHPVPTTTVSTRANLRIRFARSMKAATVEPRLRLEPPAAGRVEWSGTTLTFIPAAPLQPATNYQVVLAPGIEEVTGRASRAPFAWRFRTRAPSVVVLRRQEGVANLWLIEPDSSAARQVTREPVNVLDFAVAPDGERIAFTRRDGPSGTGIWLTNLDGGPSKRLSSEAMAASLSAPAWSPDGGLLAVEHRWDLPGAFTGSKLFFLRADGSSGGMIYGRGDEVGIGARWSPDGLRLALFDPMRSVVVILHFFTRERLYIPIREPVAFDWSPDGRSLVIEDSAGDQEPARHALLLADVATGVVTPLMDPTVAAEGAPSWSPDGRQVAFVRRPAAGEAGATELAVVEIGSGVTRPLAANVAAHTPLRLAWSADGRQVLLSSRSPVDPQAGPAIWLVDAVDGQTRRLVDGAAAAWLP